MDADDVHEIWDKIQHLFHTRQRGKALHHFLDLLFPDTSSFGYLDNPGYSQEVNAFNRASEACRQLADTCESKQEISRIFCVDGNTAHVMFSLGGYELTWCTFDLSGRGALIGADLSGVDLSSADLRGQKLTGANLREANLRGMNLTLADLTGADLTGAFLQEAVLYGAIFDGAVLDGAVFDGAFFDGTVCDETVFDGAVLGWMKPKYMDFL